LFAHLPEQNPHHETDVVDQAGHRIVALLREAADASAENVERAVTMAHKASMELRAAEERITLLEAEVERLGRQILILSVGSERELEPALASLAQHRSVALLVSGHSLFTGLRKRLVVVTARQALPTMHYLREFTVTGELRRERYRCLSPGRHIRW
jgi:hypothetical protein